MPESGTPAGGSGGSGPNPKCFIPISDAIEAVPIFDGQPSDVRSFIQGCKDALDMIEPQFEFNLVRIIRNKMLQGSARRVFEDEKFDTIDKLTSRVSEIYGPVKSVNICQEELSILCQREDEEVVTYAARVRDCISNITQAFVQDRRTDDFEAFKRNAESDGKEAFLRGLRPEIERKISNIPDSFSDLVDQARRVEKLIEIRRSTRRGGQIVRTEGAAGVNYTQAGNPQKCTICGRQNHETRDCYYGKDRSDRKRGNQSQNNHDSRDRFANRQPGQTNYQNNDDSRNRSSNQTNYQDNPNSRDSYPNPQRYHGYDQSRDNYNFNSWNLQYPNQQQNQSNNDQPRNSDFNSRNQFSQGSYQPRTNDSNSNQQWNQDYNPRNRTNFESEQRQSRYNSRGSGINFQQGQNQSIPREVCGYCKNIGHIMIECRKRRRDEQYERERRGIN